MAHSLRLLVKINKKGMKGLLVTAKLDHFSYLTPSVQVQVSS
jgi:hypothetical protein